MVNLELDSESGFLFIKLQQTENCRIHDQISNIINSEFKQNPKLFNQDLQLLNDLRTDSLVNITDIDLGIIIKLKKYISLLYKLKEILPSQSIEFKWNNNKSSSISYEIQNCLLQLAAYYSKLSINYYNESSLESLKRSGIYFQYSAGCLNLLNDDPNNNSYINLLLAQAQEIYYEKAILDNFKDSIIGKLSIQISDYYNNIQIDRFQDYLTLKANYFKCIAYSKYSNIFKAGKKYGTSISYLQECEKLCNNNINSPDYCKVLQNFENLKINVLNNLQIMKFENEMVYLDKIPKFKTINELPRAILVKCLSPKDIEIDSTFLNGLIPLSTINNMEIYTLRFEEFIENEITIPINKYMNEIDKILESSNIIELIENLSDNKLPNNIIEYRNELIRNGNIENLTNLSNSLISLKLECKDKIDHVWKLLKDQLIYEESLAKSYGYDNWKLDIIDHDKTCSILINSFKIYENYLKQGNENGDELIKVQINELIPFLKIFDDYNDLLDYLPDAEYLKLNPNLNDCVEKTQIILCDFKSFKIDAEKFLENVIRKKNKFDLIKLYNSNRDIEELLKNEILKFENELKFVETCENKKIKLIKEFNENLTIFHNLNNKLILSPKRLETLKVLKSTYDGYFETLENLNKGLEFYNNLKENLVIKLNQLNQFLIKRNETVHMLREGFV